ncbi:hypothetical protein [Bradyrhizobium sp. NC92]|uniref:hypothetical protein n=1 Tax=Bradyrhizobium sp. (strain NC92) TaxID=55395 RepID=UPI0021AAF7E2|nr:hypothetical protein [Bradyrhizobium sp. NC92]UWU68187.1 hypothetical protein N2602_34655 [Bradyrhizobium sp. NC92]
MNFQVTVLKILVSYPDGFASMSDLKRDMAILATSGPEWAERTKRMGARVPGLDIFSQGLIERINGGWRITNHGRAVLEAMEARPSGTGARIDQHGAPLETSAAADQNLAAIEPFKADAAPPAAAKIDGRRSTKRRLSPLNVGSGRAIRS